MTEQMIHENIISMSEVLKTLALFIENGSYDNEELIYFVSEFSGVSSDEIQKALSCGSFATMPGNTVNAPIPRERVISILQSYISNDAEAADPEYVREALEQAGCDESEAEELGLGWVFDA